MTSRSTCEDCDLTSNWSHLAAEQMREKADRVASAPLPILLGQEHLFFSSLEEDALAAVDRLTQANVGKDRCLYLIELDDEADPQEVMSLFRKTKSETPLKLPKDNGITTQCLYIGSSFATGKRKKSLRSRLRQHLLGPGTSTFGLALAQWATMLEGGIYVSTWHYPDDGRPESTMREIMLAIEEWLSNQKKPMLGQQGIKN